MDRGKIARHARGKIKIPGKLGEKEILQKEHQFKANMMQKNHQISVLYSKWKTQLLLELFQSNKAKHEIVGLMKLIDNIDVSIPMEPPHMLNGGFNQYEGAFDHVDFD